jgi:superoxide dismutase
LRELMKIVGGIWSHIFFCQILFEELMKKVGGIWSHIIFCQILFPNPNPNPTFCIVY